jgi:hypothetical protein
MIVEYVKRRQAVIRRGEARGPSRSWICRPGTGATRGWLGESKAVEVSWYSRLRNLMRNALKREVSMRDMDATDDYPTPTLLTLVPGVLRLRYGVISTVGNYREQNEDNY